MKLRVISKITGTKPVMANIILKAAHVKRKPLIAVGLGVLFTLAVVLRWSLSPVHFVGGFSPKDFKEIQGVVRQEMWRRVFPSLSMKTIVEAPGSLWFLARSRIEQVDVFEGGEHVRVRVRTPLGLYGYAMQKSRTKDSQPAWRVLSTRLLNPQIIKKLESYAGFTKLQPKGGSGLLGGRLPSLFVTLAVYPERVPDRISIPLEPRGLGSNNASLSLGVQRVVQDDTPSALTSRQGPVDSVDQFSASLSNRAALQLKP